MSCNIVLLHNFKVAAKPLQKRYRSLKDDLRRFRDDLQSDPHQGVELYPGIRKVRLAISSLERGKSGGARVITYDALVTELGGTLYLVDIYAKSDQDSVSVEAIRNILRCEGLL